MTHVSRKVIARFTSKVINVLFLLKTSKKFKHTTLCFVGTSLTLAAWNMAKETM